MPHRHVNRGVQDEEELARIRNEQKRKRKEKAAKWCQMIGLTVAEFILCLICFFFGYHYYHSIETFRNVHHIRHKRNSLRYILLPPTPLAVSSVYLTLTCVDLLSWQSLRPITYFGWIMVATSGFLMFLLYAGVIILSCNSVMGLIAILFGCITALVFLADLICMLMSLKRFPIPYWVMKRKSEKTDQCVCTGDYNPEEEEVERPLCRCGDHWGEPCTCDDPQITCGCGAEKKGKPPCECCQCAAQTLPLKNIEDERSIVSTMSGRDVVEERRKSILTQSMPVEEFYRDEFCSQSLGPYCVSAPRQQSVMARMSIARQSAEDPSISRKSVAAQSQMSRKSTYSQRLASPSMGTTSRAGRASLSVKNAMVSMPMGASSRTTNISMDPSRMGRVSIMANRMTRQSLSPVRGIENPSTMMAAKIGCPHSELTETLGTPSMALASRLGIHKSLIPRNKSQLSYSVYTTAVDDEEALHESIASKYQSQGSSTDKSAVKKSIFYDGRGQAIHVISRSSTEEEIGEGDYSRRSGNERHKKSDRMRLKFSTYTSTECLSSLEAEPGYVSDPEISQGPRTLSALPGQVSSLDDTAADNYHVTKKNVSVSARERGGRRLPSTIRNELARPRTTLEGLGGPRIIRNVSTTVRAIRTLSRVMEADNESRSVSQSDGNRESDRFPSECTITIHK